MMNGKEALERLRRKIEGAYHERLTEGPKDYPPYAIMSWDDRAIYHRFILKLLDETMREVV